MWKDSHESAQKCTYIHCMDLLKRGEKQAIMGHQETEERSRLSYNYRHTNWIDLHNKKFNSEVAKGRRTQKNGIAKVWATMCICELLATVYKDRKEMAAGE